MTHADLVKALAKPGEDILKSLTPEKCHLLHMVLALPGEVGELIDAIKKYIFYNKPLDMANVVEELGDIEFYLEGLRAGLGVPRDTTLEHNINKLTERYGATYSDAAAQARVDKC